MECQAVSRDDMNRTIRLTTSQRTQTRGPRGGFADRGVHTMKGNVKTVFETPHLEEMRCGWCKKHGVTVTALAPDDRLLGWCGLEHSRLGGLRLPLRAEDPSPPPSRRHAERRTT
jgi:hypothetical protein